MVKLSQITSEQRSNKMSQGIQNFADYLDKGAPEKDENQQNQKSSSFFDHLLKDDEKYKKQYDNMVTVENDHDRQQKYNKKVQQINKNIEQEENGEKGFVQDQEEQDQKIDDKDKGIPFLITKSMKLQLLDIGFSMEQIKQLTPQQAYDILKSRKK